MKFIPRKEIDIKRWDKRIAESSVENIFCYSWYLDAVADHWGAVVTDNYKTIVPIPYTSKLGLKQMYQAPFTREYDIFGDEFNWPELAEFLARNFKAIDFRNGEKEIFPKSIERHHQYLSLSASNNKNYSENATRILKRSKNSFELKGGSDPGVLVDLFEKFVAGKIETVKKADVLRLEKLMRSALKIERGELLFVLEHKNVVGAGFFLFDKGRITYLKGASTDQAMKAGAMYFLMDSAIKRYQADYRTFDFGGSEIAGVAQFFKKFGALDRKYYHYRIDKLPTWFKTLKRIRK